jgi:protein O-GlcNAc transferase
MDIISDGSVTIGIPVYNEEKYLKATIISAINQTYKNIKIIISDNNSTDNSFLIAQEFVDKFGNLAVVKHEENIGALNNFKYSLDNAKTEYFMWLGAHDVITKTYIEDSVNYLNSNKDVALVYHNAVFFTDNIDNSSESANSDIDTSGLRIEDRMLKIATDLANCTMINGVFRTQIAKSLPFKRMVGPDHLMLFATAEMGHIINLSKLGFYRRNIHAEETNDEALLRFQKIQLYKAVDNNPYALFTLNHLKYILFSRKLSLRRKLKLVIAIKKVFYNRFNVTWEQLIKQIFIKE